MDGFTVLIDNIPKIVFSHRLKNVEWKNVNLAKRSIEEEVLEFKQQTGKDILVGSRSFIVTLLNFNSIDEFQLSVQPIIAKKGLPLFENINDRIILKLLKIKTFSLGTIICYYEPARK